MPQADMIQPACGGVDDDNLGRFAKILSLAYDIGQGLIKAHLVFANYYYGNHR
jgi:hypothetical protein